MGSDKWVSLDSLEQPQLDIFCIAFFMGKTRVKNLTVTTTVVQNTKYSTDSEDKRISNVSQNNLAGYIHSLT